ncbi:unnamed protein product [Spirodela intermedia]|uniref:Uncharacterized protein n=1 Tax=Spirodela intermedia TaxID=51605 RepID=A0A7I8K135_SPIIN|nr:unnamed protein product [Spirodela intermedia]
MVTKRSPTRISDELGSWRQHHRTSTTRRDTLPTHGRESDQEDAGKEHEQDRGHVDLKEQPARLRRLSHKQSKRYGYQKSSQRLTRPPVLFSSSGPSAGRRLLLRRRGASSGMMGESH